MDWIALGLLGGLVALDATTFPQVMFSRPIVSATLAGCLTGHPELGLAIGVVLEVFGLVVLPFGAARYPEAGPAAVAAAGAAAAGPEVPLTVVMTVVITVALLWESVAGYTVLALRRTDERLVAAQPEGVPDPASLERRHLSAMTLDFGRGVLLALVGAVLGLLALRLVLPVWELDPELTGQALRLALIAMLGAALSVFGGFEDHRRWFLAGIAGGVLLLAVA